MGFAGPSEFRPLRVLFVSDRYAASGFTHTIWIIPPDPNMMERYVWGFADDKKGFPGQELFKSIADRMNYLNAALPLQQRRKADEKTGIHQVNVVTLPDYVTSIIEARLFNCGMEKRAPKGGLIHEVLGALRGPHGKVYDFVLCFTSSRNAAWVPHPVYKAFFEGSGWTVFFGGKPVDLAKAIDHPRFRQTASEELVRFGI